MISKFLKTIALSAILFASPLKAMENFEGTNFQIGADNVFDIVENDKLFGTKNTKLDKAYGFHVSILNMKANNSEVGIEGGYRVHSEKSKAPFHVTGMENNKYDALSLENKMWTVMLKANHYLVSETGSIMPYIGGGIGGVKTNFSFDAKIKDKPSVKQEDVIKKIKLAYSGEAGVVAGLSSSTMVGVAVQYFGVFDLKKDDFDDTIMGENTLGEGKIRMGEYSTKFFLKMSV